MIKFGCRRRHKDGTPIVKDKYIIEYAEAILADYRPELLEYPGHIDGLHFLETYLKANLDFQDIYYEEGKSPIAGATVFNDENVTVFDRENGCIRDIPMEADTVIIDNATMQEGKEGFALFTQLHEAGHFCMHPAVYKRDPYQISIFDFGVSYAPRSVVMCKRTAIEKKRGQLNTQEDFREHQANVFAAAMEMPRKPFYREARRLIHKYDVGRNLNSCLVRPDKFNMDFEEGYRHIIKDLSEAFGSSRRATEIQLKTLQLLMTEEEYSNRHNNLIDKVFY